MNLKHLTDKQLLVDTKQIAKEDRKLTMKLLHHIKEVDHRKLYSDAGHPSLFRYVVQELGFSEGSAGRRINSARLLKDIPEIEVKIENGDLTLSNISKAADKFRQENITDKNFKLEILNTIENSSTRTCEKTLSEIITPGTLPLSPTRPIVYNLNLNESNHKKFEEIRGFYAHKRLTLDEIMSEAFDCTLEILKSDRFKTNSISKTNSPGDSRYIPAATKKFVYERDRSCRKCGSTFALEFDHIHPFAFGGKSEPNNLRLLCRNCNQRARISARL